LKTLVCNKDFVDQLIALNLLSDYYEDAFGKGWLRRNSKSRTLTLVSPSDSVWKKYVIIDHNTELAERILIFENDNIAFTCTTCLSESIRKAFSWENSTPARTIWIKKVKYTKNALSLSNIFQINRLEQSIQTQQSFLFLMRNLDIITDGLAINLAHIEGII